MSTTTDEQQELDEIRGLIGFGLDVEAFMSTRLGRYLTEKANADVQSAAEALLEVDPEDPKAIRKLQTKAAAAGMFLLWLGEAVTLGENAQREFESRG